MAQDITETWQTNGQIFIVLLPRVFPMHLSASETINQDGFSFIIIIKVGLSRDTIKQHYQGGKVSVLTRACGSLNSPELLVMREFQSLVQGGFSLLQVLCFSQGEEGGVGTTMLVVGQHVWNELDPTMGQLWSLRMAKPLPFRGPLPQNEPWWAPFSCLEPLCHYLAHFSAVRGIWEERWISLCVKHHRSTSPLLVASCLWFRHRPKSLRSSNYAQT